MKRTIAMGFLISGALFFAGCAQSQPQESADPKPSETPAVSDRTPQPTVESAAAVAKPYSNSVINIVDESALSKTYETVVGPEGAMGEKPRFDENVTVEAVELGNDGYTHIVLKDTRNDTELRFAVLTALPDMNVEITGGLLPDSDQLRIAVSFYFDLSVVNEYYENREAFHKYGLAGYMNQYAFLNNRVEYANYLIVQNYNEAEPFKGYHVVETEGDYSLITGDVMFGYADTILESSEAGEEDKTGLSKLVELGQLVKLDR